MPLFGFFKKKEKKKLDYLIVGLGNPDDEYLATRHNIGWMVVDSLVEKNHIKLNYAKDLSGYFGVFEYQGKQLGILKPTTYMNRSGQSISKAEYYYDIKEENIIIVVDEYNFPVNKIHLKIGGSDSGHNGLTSVMGALPNNKFLRLRCGIDKNFGPGELVDYVLSPFNSDEIDKLNQMIENAVKSILFLTSNPLPKATSFINSGKLWENEDKSNGKDNIINSKN